MTTYVRTLRGHITSADKAASDYALIPFSLSQPARRLHVRYRYSDPISSDQREGGNVIDVGLFDPRGHQFPGGVGFRGWSGSARNEFVITPQSATPGYLPGPLPAGTYHVILGLYRIWAQGADYEIEIEADLDEALDANPEFDQQHNAPVRSSVVGRPSSSAWLCGDLQSHTVHSDARGTLDQLVGKARALGLDFLAVTDHNTVSHHPHLPPLSDERLLLIPGQEVTTYYGHMNVWGTSRWCDFRCKSDEEMAAVIALAHASGGVCSINHPKRGGPEWEYSTDLPVDAMEVWQGPWPHRNQESLALWDRLLASGQRLPAVGGSDYHCPSGEETNFLRLGQPTTWVRAHEYSVPGILEAIAAGRVCISATPDGPRLDLAATAGGHTAVMGQTISCENGERLSVRVAVSGGRGRTLHLIADGAVAHAEIVDADETQVAVELDAQTYVRAELVGDADPAQLPPDVPSDLDLRDWRWALSNPIYVRR